MHTRKHFLVYPPNYVPGDGYVTTYSKRQAMKRAVRFGAGASVDVSVYKHLAKHQPWQSSSGYSLWVYTLKEQN